VHVTTFEDAVEALLNAREREIGSVRLVNAWCVVLAEDDDAYRQVVNGPGLSLPDGAPVVAAMRKQSGGESAQRVRGPSLFEAVLERGQHTELRHFLLGGAPDTLEALIAKIGAKYPDATIAGSWSPPFVPLDDATTTRAAEMATSARADIIWVGMGAPKQDILAARIAERTGRTAVGVGAAFDFLAGTVREAPVWMQRVGMEWLFRLLAEPRRLWKRYLVGNVRFLFIAGRS